MNADAILHAAPGNCPNCFAETAGNFCHQCSQETTLHPPSAREFMHEFIGHYVALEGKLWQSLWLLLVKPGRLTLEYLRGRRVRYVQPLRLYLTFSLIFFALVKFSGVPLLVFGEGAATPAAVAAPGAPPAPVAPPRVTQAPPEMNAVSGAVSTVAEQVHAGWGTKVTRFLAQSPDAIIQALTRAFFAYGPYALFALMPVFALLLKLLYLGTGRRYGAHLLFALHANAFAFAMMALQVAVPSRFDFVHSAMAFWMVLYLPLALHRVYGGSWPVTLLRWVVLALLHLLCIILAILATVSSAAVA